MKKYVRFIGLILACLMLISAFISCAEVSESEESKNNESSASEYTAETETQSLEYTSELENKDFGKKVFTFFVQSSPGFVHTYDVNTDKTIGEPVNDAVYERNRSVEDKYNVVINDENAGGDEAKQKFKGLLKSGDDMYNATWFRTDDFFQFMIDGAYVEISQIPGVNLEKLYWDQNAVSDYTIGGKLYGIMGDISTSANVFTHLFGINKKVAIGHGIDVSQLYQTVFNGDWTVEEFVKVCKNCLWTNLNDNPDRDGEDLFAFGTSPSIMFGAFSAAGEQWIVKNSSGEYELSSLTDRKTDVIDKIVEITNDLEMTVATWNIGQVAGVSDTYAYTYRTKFMNDTLLFSDLDMGEVLDMRGTMKSEFGIVPLPKYDKAQESYSVFAYPFYPLLSVPVTLSEDKYEMTGYVIEALAAGSYTTLTPEFYGVVMGSKVLCDEESTKMLDIILRNRRYELLLIYAWGADTFRTQVQGLSNNKKGSIASVYKKNATKINKSIEAVTNSISKLE